MNNYVNIPEHFDQEEKLSALLDSILNMLTLDTIFLSELQNEGGNPYYFITAFVDANIDPIPNEVINIIAKIEKEYPYFKIRIYTEATSETALERGSLYFVEHCCLGFIVYANSEGETTLDYQSLPVNKLLKRTVRYFSLEMRKIAAFNKTADRLITEKQLGIAAFNLHQAFELSFRFIEQMCIGKSKITHSIISHIKYCEPYFPKLKPFLKDSKQDNNELLLLLEHAYSVARYGDEYQISEAQIHSIRSEFNGFINEVEALYRKHLNQCRQRIAVTGNNGMKL
ncbi:HEPN domain-containing protein [Seonamhaeicola sp. NFXS20]|uniref:HEPN domain-containing protein n=1 Tax=Seonamhaeicola sp. NFXS20 TaxID=2816959 RepID=UPI003B9FE219